MWYVVQVVGGKEKHVLKLMEKFVDAALIDECFVPQYVTKKRRSGSWHSVNEVLIPGYIFVVTSNPDRLAYELKAVPSFTKLLSNNKVFIPLNNEEVAFINAFTEVEHRVVDMSVGIIEGDKIVVLNGPLMNQEGLIKKVDRHKRIAFLEVELMGRKKTIKIGLEIVRKKP